MPNDALFALSAVGTDATPAKYYSGSSVALYPIILQTYSAGYERPESGCKESERRRLRKGTRLIVLLA